MSAQSIDSKLTAMGKDERAISVSGYVHRGEVKYSEHAFNKTSIYKRKSRNHLLDQVESFRIGDKDSDREDDLLDTFWPNPRMPGWGRSADRASLHANSLVTGTFAGKFAVSGP
jgi:hypothetical protein